MGRLFHQLLESSTEKHGDSTAIFHKEDRYNYSEVFRECRAVANGLRGLGLEAGDRVAIYLPKLPETIFGFFGASFAGGAFVPVNPLLKAKQVKHILKDSGSRILITSADRLTQIESVLDDLTSLESIICLGHSSETLPGITGKSVHAWTNLIQSSPTRTTNNRKVDDLAALLYTSGSTGRPKGVMVSHNNLVVGAESVAQYLRNKPSDRLLAVMPFSFDYGLSQVTTAFSVGASIVLMDYLLPRDVLRAVERYKVSGLAAVPPLWNQLIALDWSDANLSSLRYITNTGGAMPTATTGVLRDRLPGTDLFLMYGLTEAFRSTYLPPDQLEARPTSMGKSIPNADIWVLRDDGGECEADEVGELVHGGPLVTLGYWNNPEKTAKRYRKLPDKLGSGLSSDIAVWSGDSVKKDNEGFLYFVGRKDEMIKTSGYRVSPFEIEEILFNTGLLRELAVIGADHPLLGQAIVLIGVPEPGSTEASILSACKKELPNFQVPKAMILVESLPRNPNGKIDRQRLANDNQHLFNHQEST